MYEYIVKEIVKIVDGDTVDIVLDLGFDVYRKERVRINRVDTPESNSKDATEKKLAIEAKNYVSTWMINQKKIRIKTFKDDKYGRLLGELYGDEDVCLSDLLINGGYAWAYDGGTKNKDLNLLLEKRNKK
jgi:micrococcal nuclease